MDRRQLLRASAGLGLAAPGLLGLDACATAGSPAAPVDLDAAPPLAPIRAEIGRLFDVTVCLRPFRAAGPRLEVEQVGPARVVHNYGHGGSGWSLSWGSSTLAVQRAMEGSPREVAVVGCGALGITSAILAQEAGAQVTIYARDLLPQTRSARATGSWTPDSRVALASAAGPAFAERWETMARTSFKRYRQYLGLPGEPVEWLDFYKLSDLTPGQPQPNPAPRRHPELDFAEYGDRIADIVPRSHALPPGSAPFPTRYVRRGAQLTFNIADYAHTLLSDFRAAGGRFERREFSSLSELGALPQATVINCPGYGARALCRDESVVPVRGQIAWLVPQPEARYAFFYDGISVISRRDGIVVQDVSGGDEKGYGDDREVIDRADAEHAVHTVAALYARPWPGRRVSAG